MYECETWPPTKMGKRTRIEVILERGAEANTWMSGMGETVR